MPTSYNGWPASVHAADLNVGPFVVAGVNFPGGVRRGDVATVLGYVAQQFHHRVEHLEAPGCWGWSYRQNRNAANLSCHSSATAIDINAPKHPNGVDAAKTFSDAQIKAIHAILAEVPELASVVHWGGDWHRPNLTPDPMHFEIHDHDTAKLARVAARIRAIGAKEALAPTRVTQAREHLIQARALLVAARAAAGPIRKAAIAAALAALAACLRALPKR